MTTPILGLGITASGAAAVAALAESVNSLANGLVRLKDTAGGGEIQALSEMAAQIRGMRSELMQGLAGVQATLVEGFNKAYASAAQAVTKGGEQIAQAQAQAKAKIRYGARSDQGGGLSASISGSDAEAVRKLKAEADSTSDALATSATKISTAQTLAGIKMGMSTMKWTQTQAEAATAEEEALSLRRIKLGMGTLKLTQAQEAAAVADQQGQLLRGIKTAMGTLKLTQAQEAAAAADQQAQMLRGIKTAMSTMKWTQAQEASAAAELEAAAKKAAAITLAQQRVDAAYDAMGTRSQLRAQIRARAQLNQGIAPDLVTASLGSGAVAGAAGATMRDLQGQLEALGVKSATATPKVKGLAEAMNDAHSAARGLASGFGAMFLTWGNLIPLLAGAAISHGVVQVVKLGAEVGNTFEIIRVLSQETVASVNDLRMTMVELGRSGPFGPLAIAEAMKTLSLAGLSAKEVGSSIKDVLNFAVAGTTSIQTAADVLTTVGVAFKVSASDYNYIGDVISKAAAVSKSSVEGMGAAFKTASTVNSLYGVSLKDVGINLALLANVGIQNSNAGTSLTNMYIDLAGRTPKATKALKELGVAALDPLTGKMRALGPLFKELLEKLAEKTPVTQLEYINSIFAQRSRKDVVAIVDSMRTAAKEGGEGVKSEFDRITAEMAQSAGFQAEAAVMMTLTPLNQMKSVAATLQTTFVETFSKIEPLVVSVSARLKQAFTSDGFQNSLERIVMGVGALVEILANNLGTIAIFGAALVAWKVSSGLGAMFMGMAAGVTALGVAANTTANSVTKLAVAQEAQTVAAAAAGATTAGTLLTGLGSVLGVVARLVPWVTAAWGAWQLYSIWTDRASASNGGMTGATFEATLDALKRETDRLHELNEAKRTGISLDVIRARSSLEATQQTLQDPVKAAQRKVFSLEEQLGNSGQTLSGSLGGAQRQAKARIEKQLAEARTDLAKAQQIYEEQKGELDNQLAALKAEAQEMADRVEAAMVPKAPAHGTGTRPENNPGLASSAYAQQLKLIKEVIANYREQAKEIDEAFKTEETSATNSYQRGADDYTTYQNRLNDIAQRHAQARTSWLTLEQAEVRKLLPELANKSDSLDPKKRAAKETLANSNTEIQRMLDEDRLGVSKQITGETVRQDNALTAMLKPSADLVNNADKESAKIANNFQQEMDRLAVKKDTVEVSAKEQFIQTEIAKAVNAQADYVSRIKATLNDGIDKGAFGDLTNPDVYANFQNLIRLLGEAETQLAKFKDQARGGAATFFDNKTIDDARKKAEDLWQRDEKKIEDGIFDAIGKGGNSGFKKLMQDAKSWFARLVLSPIIQPIAAFGASMINPTAQSAVNGAGGSAVNSILGNAGGSMLTGSALGGSIFGASGAFTNISMGAAATMQNGLIGGFGANMANIGAMAGGGSPMMALGAAMPYIAAAVAAVIVISKLLGKGGGPKADGKFGTTYTDIASQDNSLAKSVQPAVEGLQAQYDGMVKNFGGVPGGVNFGMAISRDPKGDSPTFLEASASKNGQKLFSNLNRNVGRSDEDLTQALAVAAVDSLIGALKASDLSKQYKEYFDSIATDATLELKTAAVKTANDVAGYALSVSHMGGVFDKLTTVSVEARGAMINAAGGLQALQQATQSYFNNFYKADERKAITTARIGDVFKSVGLDLGTIDLNAADARTQFRKLVDSLDTSTESGRLAFNVLMGVSDAFASVTTALDDTTTAARSAADILSEQQGLQKSLNELMLDTAANRRSELAALDPSNRALQERIYLLTDSKSGTDVAMAALKRAIDAQKKLLQEQADAAQKSIDTLKSLFDFLAGQVNELYNQTLPQMMGAAGRQFVTDALSIARATGKLPDQTALSNSVSAARGIGDNTFKTAFDAMYAKLTLAGQLSELQKMAGDQLTDAQKQLKAAQDQIAALDKIAEDAQKQLDALRGIDVSVHSVSEAINNLAVAMKLESALTGRGVIDGPISTGGNNVTATGTPDGGISWSNGVTITGDQFAASQKASQFRNSAMLMYEGLLGRVEDQGAAAWVEQAYNQGGTLDDILNTIKGSQEYSSFQSSGAANPFQSLIDSGVIPHFDVGTNRVSQDMLAFIHKDEAVVPAAYNPAAGGHDDVSVAINDLREEQCAQASAQVAWQRRFTKLMERWDADGMPETRVV